VDGQVWDRLEQLLEFPVDFPIKVMGRRTDEFARSIVDRVLAHQPDFDPSRIEMRASSGGAWLSLTVVVRAVSRAQLQALYEDLARHPLVKVVL
jgi:putative lipoic acid-binding regulatory protein